MLKIVKMKKRNELI